MWEYAAETVVIGYVKRSINLDNIVISNSLGIATVNYLYVHITVCQVKLDQSFISGNDDVKWKIPY
jgi:hypothetical protein